jgi:hypothetical protein
VAPFGPAVSASAAASDLDSKILSDLGSQPELMMLRSRTDADECSQSTVKNSLALLVGVMDQAFRAESPTVVRPG